MTKRPLWKSHAAQAALFTAVLAIAWMWDAVSSGHLQEQLARVVLACSVLAGVLVWMQKPDPRAGRTEPRPRPHSLRSGTSATAATGAAPDA
ncbi:MAG TPA: hypothetical protein VM032_01415 [Vicinamibacterales bacterium]|nr:hypothetical protein [Vicinamibacterales bacterium]